jgi:hypothetical protein
MPTYSSVRFAATATLGGDAIYVSQSNPPFQPVIFQTFRSWTGDNRSLLVSARDLLIRHGSTGVYVRDASCVFPRNIIGNRDDAVGGISSTVEAGLHPDAPSRTMLAVTRWEACVEPIQKLRYVAL